MELGEAIYLLDRSKKKFLKSLLPFLEELSQRRDSASRILASDTRLVLTRKHRKIAEELFQRVAVKRAIGMEASVEDELASVLAKGMSEASYTPLIQRAVDLGVFDEQFVTAEKQRLLHMYGEGIIPKEVVDDLS